ncbi:hypothetical protein [Turneriella parva]|uniref:Outer membrane protein beta-barrel domain-containing protein n=1 Tax=Turneriella parva (strain ATCC BAA-1111 / DSM 21527 / NCTC 11395 / H) TaxID=869212 RepID=I4B414_TURPD|nr:hypothetical protein [Turneriella parva]AFM12021.1 hypothetical protein Turpa_1373 [Turneriella parva DSM 21527]
MPRLFFMPKTLRHICLLVLTTGALSAQVESEQWRFKPQLGLWFGPVTPVPNTRIADVLTTSLGGGLFFRGNLPTNTLRTEIGFSYSYYTSRTVARLHSIPVYGALVYTLPINLPLSFYVKVGGGGNFLRNYPEGSKNWLPAGYLGFETSFPAGRLINIGVRADYFFVYEQYLSPPPNNPNYEIHNAHFLNFGLMVNFNLSR